MHLEAAEYWNSIWFCLQESVDDMPNMEFTMEYDKLNKNLDNLTTTRTPTRTKYNV